jgi:hypothetical protein
MSPCGIRTGKSWNESGTPLSRQEARPTGSWLSEGMRSNPALLPGRGRARARCCLLAVLLVRYQNRCAECERYVLPSRRLLNNSRQVSNKFLQFNRNGNYAYRRSEQAMARASGLASQRCVFVQDASQHLPRVKTADLASGTLFGSSEGTDDRYDFER